MLRSRLVPAIAGAVALVVIGVGAWWWFQAPAPDRDEAPIATAETSEPEAPPPVAGTEPTPAAPEQEQTGAPEEPVAAPQVQTGAPGDQAAAPQDQVAAAPDMPAPAPEQPTAALPAPATPSRPPSGEAGAPAEKGTEVAALPPAEPLDCPPESDAPGCALAAQALRAVGGSAAAQPEVMLNQPNGIYLDQEYLVVEAGMPAELGGYLYLDVLTDAGQVFHLLPEPMREDNALPAGGNIQVGVEEADRAAGVRHWQIAGPFSDGYLLATVSEKRLYDGLRPIEESIADYRDVLLRSLADPATGRKAARVERLKFLPRS